MSVDEYRDYIQTKQDIEYLKEEVKKLKQKLHAADIPELRRKAGLTRLHDDYPYADYAYF